MQLQALNVVDQPNTNGIGNFIFVSCSERGGMASSTFCGTHGPFWCRLTRVVLQKRTMKRFCCYLRQGGGYVIGAVVCLGFLPTIGLR